jgi:hypothetical protein
MHYSSPTRFTLSNEHIALMLHKLRDANERYAHIAAQVYARMRTRRQYRPYRVRAAWLGLRVDIDAALALSDTQVSNIPLPILDMTPTPVEPKIFIRIPPSHMRYARLPSITTTAPTPMVKTDMSRVAKIYSPIPIPARGPLVQLDGINWGVPGAPLLRPRELPVIMPDAYVPDLSPMSLDSGTSVHADLDSTQISNYRCFLCRPVWSIYTGGQIRC